MKKGNKIFILVFLIEIALLLMGRFFIRRICNYPTPCSVPTFLNPLGNQLTICIQMIAQAPCNLGIIYQTIWLIIFTAIAYIIYLIIKKFRKK